MSYLHNREASSRNYSRLVQYTASKELDSLEGAIEGAIEEEIR